MGIKKYIMSAAVIAASLSSCTQGFEDMNQNPWTANNLDVKHQFAYAQAKMYSHGHEGFRGNLIMSQVLSGVAGCRYTAGAGFSRSDGYTNATWEVIYRDVMKNIVDARTKLEAENTDGSKDAQLAQLNVVKNIALLRATLLYGDIPFHEAGQGFHDRNFFPSYDTQKEVLNSMVEEIKADRDAILASKATDLLNYDLYFEGDQASWGRLANSLLMRIGLTMSSADEAKGKEVFKEAYENKAGYISALSESAVLEHSELGGPWGQHINGSGVANEGRVGGFAHAFMSSVTLKSMQELQDPRLFWVTTPLDMSSGSSKAFTNMPDFDPFQMAENSGEPFKPVSLRGLRPGDVNEGRQGTFVQDIKEENGDIAKEIQVAGLWVQKNDKTGELETNYGRLLNEDGKFMLLAGINPETILGSLSPTMIMSADEVHFMIAEAAQRGWVGASAADELKLALQAAFDKYPTFYPGQSVVNSLINTYKASTGSDYDYQTSVTAYIDKVVAEFNGAGLYGDLFQDQLDIIIYQHWLSQLGNGYKAYAMWNRTHYPSVVKDQFVGSDRDVSLPVYTDNPILTGNYTPNSYQEQEFHRGGVTNGVRPSRFPYPDRELTVNAAKVSEAMNRQRSDANESSIDFIGVKQWFSFNGKH
ncbi:SusD/RagB family nutrient-binding outer membrane lipoprotein [Persicobacter psychrovividus]|uniref:SusD/RagB family nutrient-binding outer membrane lipoprotein n=1 Tax=Persicobacter psychrovividus TaxID=387638 RepID=A0ABM7VHQ5_9BACT|nr:hypothetical protein PEPS_27700 [Persicobacter psychrovividus]